MNRDPLLISIFVSLPAFGGRFPLNRSTLHNLDFLRRFARRRSARFHRLDQFLALDDLAEYHVLAVEVRRRNGGDEELRAVPEKYIRPRQMN